MVDVIGVLPLFVAVNDGIFPEPFVADKPIAGLLFVHVKLVAPLPPVKLISLVVPGHIVCLPGLVTVGVWPRSVIRKLSIARVPVPEFQLNFKSVMDPAGVVTATLFNISVVPTHRSC